MGGTKNEPGYSYSSVTPTPDQQNSEDAPMRPAIELGDHPQLSKPRQWATTILWQTFAVLWLVPVVALLYLNFTEYIIGASAWCPGGHCWVETFSIVTVIPQERARKFDHESHNLVGGLQFVAKGLEVWFGIIAAAVMYLVTMKMAGKKEGLPVGYLTRPMEFSDVITVFDPLLWKTGPSPLGAKSAAEKRLGRRVWYLIALSIFLCVLINLMGPATAVLVIPALQWIEMPRVGNRMFEQLNAASAPSTAPESWYWWFLQQHSGCSQTEIEAQNYTCSQSAFGNAMDAWFATYGATTNGDSAFASQNGLTFTINRTAVANTDSSYEILVDVVNNVTVYSDYVWWVPSRQTITDLGADLGAVQLISWGFDGTVVNPTLKALTNQPDPYETYTEYNKSLELTIARNGPIVGTIPVMWADYNSSNHWSIVVDANRQIRCYEGYDLGLAPLVYGTSYGNYTKCIRTGSGWSAENKHAQFETAQSYNEITGKIDPGVDVNVYTSDKAAFFPYGELPSWLPPACLKNGPILNNTICNWERIFTTDPSSAIYNRTQHITTIEFSMWNATHHNTTFVADFVAFQGFTKYSLDCNPNANQLGFVSTGDLPTTSVSSFPIDPAWYLAAWSVGDGGTLSSNRPSTTLLQQVMRYQLDHPELLLPNSNFDQDHVAIIPIYQTLSLLDYSTTTTTAKKSTDPERPLLQRWAQIYVWAYGLGSRTSYLGTAVAIAGCLIVLWHFVIGFTDRRRYRSPTQLVVAALEHSPRGEFADKGHDEVAMARVRFHIKDNDHQAGKYSFYEPEDVPEGPHGTIS